MKPAAGPASNREGGNIFTTEEICLASGSERETRRIGALIGSLLTAGDFVALTGELGAGKTHLTKGIAEGLGFSPPDEVNSPTFVLVNEYPARLHIHHIDAYRLQSGAELLGVGFEDMVNDQSVVILEWADRVGEIVPADALWIALRAIGDSHRELRIRTTSTRLARNIRTAVGLDQWRIAGDKRS